MKDGFKGFYNPGGEVLESVWNSDSTIFVFDTNVYLNFYSYAEKTKSDLFSILDRIKNNIWVPNHVALEYQRRRLDVIDKERENFTKITNVFNKFNNQINVEIIQNLGIEKKLPILHESLCNFLIKFNGLCDDFVGGVFEEQKKLKPDVRSSDDIRKKLDVILSGRVGLPFTQDELDKIYEEGEVRFASKIPPGFKDAGKGGDFSDFVYMGVNYKRKFGDLIIWKQLINEASKEGVKNVVFVTDDKKNDWWYGVGDKIIGPQERLQTEFYLATNVDNFKMYDTVDFLKDAVLYLGTDVDEESLDDVKKSISNAAVNISSSDLIDDSASMLKTKSSGESYVGEEIDSEFSEKLKDLRAVTESRWIPNSFVFEGFENFRDREEAMRRAGIGLENFREREEAMRRAGVGLESFRDREEAMRRAGVGLESFRDREEAMRRAGVGLESLRDREEAMRRAGVGLESLREREEAMRRAGVGLESFLGREEAIRRAGLGLDSFLEREEAVRRMLREERNRGTEDAIKQTKTDDADSNLKNDEHKRSIKKDNEDDQDSEGASG